MPAAAAGGGGFHFRLPASTPAQLHAQSSGGAAFAPATGGGPGAMDAVAGAPVYQVYGGEGMHMSGVLPDGSMAMGAHGGEMMMGGGALPAPGVWREVAYQALPAPATAVAFDQITGRVWCGLETVRGSVTAV